jgi:hypothetical protein
MRKTFILTCLLASAVTNVAAALDAVTAADIKTLKTSCGMPGTRG